MAPTKLKFKGNKAFSMLSTIENETDLSKTWRLMTKVKDALEYGKRLENLSWRLWFMHHAMVHDKKTENKFKKLSTWTTRKLEFEKSTELKKLAPVTAYRTRLPDGDKKGKKKSPTKKQTKSSTTQKTPPKNDLSSASSIATAPAPAPAPAPAQEPSSSQTEPEVTVKLKREDPAPTNDDQTTVDASDVTANNLTTSGVDNDVTKDYVKVDESIPIVEGNNLADGNMSPLSNETISQDGENFELTELVVNNVSVNDESDLNPSNMEEIFSMNGTDFVLHQFTTDQDPYQVVTLPGPFVGYDARAYIHPDRLPVMELDLEQWRLFYPHTPESSEPPSPTDIDWPHGTSTMLPVDAVTQSSSGIQSNLQYQIASSSNHQLVSNHSAVYVPRNGSTHTSNLMSALNQNLDAGNVTDLSGNNIMSNVSGSSIVYVNSQYTTDPSSNLAVTQSGNSAAAGSGSQPTNQRQAPSTSEGRPKKAHSSGEQQCFNCGVTSTPLWRRSANDELLCNACGLYLKLHKMARPKTMKPHIVRKDARDDETAQPVCSNCGTMTTPLWRRDEEGQTLCNACGLYFKLHHEKRPLSMKTDVIKKRQRYENGQNPNRRTSKKQRSTDGTSVEVQQQQHQHQQSLYAPISVSPTSASMPIPSSNVASMSTLTPSSTPAMNVPTTLGLISTVDQENSSQPISITSPTSSMTQPAPNRSMHGSFSRE